MEMKIEKMSSGKVVFDNIVLNGSINEIINYVENFGIMSSNAVKKKAAEELTHKELEIIASTIDLEYVLIDHSILTKDQVDSLINCLPTKICEYKVISDKLPSWVVGDHGNVCAYVFNSWEIDMSLEYTIAKYNKRAFGRTHADNILKVFKIDGRVIVILSEYPIRE